MLRSSFACLYKMNCRWDLILDIFFCFFVSIMVLFQVWKKLNFDSLWHTNCYVQSHKCIFFVCQTSRDKWNNMYWICSLSRCWNICYLCMILPSKTFSSVVMDREGWNQWSNFILVVRKLEIEWGGRYPWYNGILNLKSLD